MNFNEQKIWVELTKKKINELDPLETAKFEWLKEKVNLNDKRPLTVLDDRIIPIACSEREMLRSPRHFSSSDAFEAYEEMLNNIRPSFQSNKKNLMIQIQDNQPAVIKSIFRFLNRINGQGYFRLQIVISIVWITFAFINEVRIISSNYYKSNFAVDLLIYFLILFILWSPRIFSLSYLWIKAGFENDAKN